MTSKIVPRICDFCAKDITSEEKYTAQMQKRHVKGDFDEPTMDQCKLKADMCHPCFLEICKNGFEPKWQLIVAPDHGGKWITKEERDAKRADEKRNEKLDKEQAQLTAAT